MPEATTPVLKILELSHSSVSTYCDCPKKYYVSRVKKLRSRSPQSDALIKGWAVHYGLRQLRAGKKLNPEGLYDAIKEEHPFQPGIQDITELVVTILEAYSQKYEGEEYIVYETEVRAHLTQHIVIKGIPDALISEPSGIWVLETKVSAQDRASYYEASPQLLTYYWLVSQLLATPVRGAKLDLIKITRSGDIEFGDRAPILFSPRIINRWKSMVKDVGFGIQTEQFRENLYECNTLFGECPYKAYCITKGDRYTVEQLYYKKRR